MLNVADDPVLWLTWRVHLIKRVLQRTQARLSLIRTSRIAARPRGNKLVSADANGVSYQVLALGPDEVGQSIRPF